MDYSIKLIKQLNIDEINFNNPYETRAKLESILDIVEKLYSENTKLQKEVQELKDYINQLKGEKGHPIIKPNTKGDSQETVNINAKMGQRPKKKWVKSTKLDKIKVDLVEVIKVDKSTLPPDAIFKGYHRRTIQNIHIKTDNVLYKLEIYYSPKEHTTYAAPMPEALKDTQYGPELKALVLSLYFDNRVTEHKITSLLNNSGIRISEGMISNILIKEKTEELTKEKESIYYAGLRSRSYQQIDDTGFRVKGTNQYLTIVFNEDYSAFFINPSKSKKTIKENILKVNDHILPFDILVSDDAPQFDNIADERALCWVHEERHYKKLTPFLELYQQKVDEFRECIWNYYEELLHYKVNPREDKKNELSLKFDELFSTKTGYEELDERIQLTFRKKNQLLTVLNHPEVPLHNNLSEIGLRGIVVKRKISCGTKTDEGTKAWENYLTILETCRKQGIDFYEYVRDIFSGQRTLPQLSELILSKSVSNQSIYTGQGIQVN
jgi:hypothetical protein